jgi:phenylacetate-coenzyme A ligase PaaK-like adenylate-forming protein
LLDYRVVISREGNLDEVTLRVEAQERPSADSDLVHDLEAALKLKTKLRFQIEFCPAGTLPKQEIKTQRVTDLRR